jgi:hypothetical protein
LDIGTVSEASSLLAAPTKVCEFRTSFHSKCGRLPEYAVPVLDACRVVNPNGEAIDQRGQWWCFEHAKVVLTNVRLGPLADRRKEQWEDAIRNATKLICERDYGDMKLKEANRLNGYMSQVVDLLKSELEEERCQHYRAAAAHREHEAAAAAVVRGARDAERELMEWAAGQVMLEAVAVARARAYEQEVAYRAEEEDQAARGAQR